MPERVQQQRVKGWRKPVGVVSVTRATKWGNPWSVRRDSKAGRWVVKADHEASSARYLTREAAIEAAVARFKAWSWRLRDEIGELRGRDLMCFCPLDQPCHADVLLEVANEGENE